MLVKPNDLFNGSLRSHIEYAHLNVRPRFRPDGRLIMQRSMGDRSDVLNSRQLRTETQSLPLPHDHASMVASYGESGEASVCQRGGA
jgi:hypothetical protein